MFGADRVASVQDVRVGFPVLAEFGGYLNLDFIQRHALQPADDSRLVPDPEQSDIPIYPFSTTARNISTSPPLSLEYAPILTQPNPRRNQKPRALSGRISPGDNSGREQDLNPQTGNTR